MNVGRETIQSLEAEGYVFAGRVIVALDQEVKLSDNAPSTRLDAVGLLNN